MVGETAEAALLIDATQGSPRSPQEQVAQGAGARTLTRPLALGTRAEESLTSVLLPRVGNLLG